MKGRRKALALAIVFCLMLPLAVMAGFRDREAVVVEVTKEDVTEEVRFGREVAARILGRYNMYNNKTLTQYVNLVGKRVAQNTSRPELEFHFAVLDTTEINAYAAPGGYIFITKGAILLMHDENELAAVIAHETGHVVEKHIVKELQIQGSDQSVSGGLARMIGGSTDTAKIAFSQAINKAMDTLFKDGYKREDEIQADKDAVMFVAFSGYDPAALPRFLDRISKIKGKHTDILDKTHPAYADRIKWVNDTISSEGLTGTTENIHRTRFAKNTKGVK